METIYVLRENDSIVSATRDLKEAEEWRGEVASPNGGMPIYRNFRETKLMSKRERAAEKILAMFRRFPIIGANIPLVAQLTGYTNGVCAMALSSLKVKGLLVCDKIGGDKFYSLPQGPGL